MKSSEVYRRAESLIANGHEWGCCWAIVRAVYPAPDNRPLHEYKYDKQCGAAFTRFYDLLSPDGPAAGYWFEGDNDHRSTALLLLAAIAESEGD